MNKLLIIYRLFNPTYGEQGNPKTLSVYLREDNTLGYSFYGGWQDGGTPFSISNLQMKESLPIGVKTFKNINRLQKRVSECLSTGVGSNKIKKVEVLNTI
jgi:hypothetical protein